VRLRKINDIDLIVQGLADMAATRRELQKLNITLLEVLEKNLEPAQVESRVRETNFADLVEFLPKDRAELYAFLALLLTIIQLIVSLHASAPTITPAQVGEIIERVLDDHNQQDTPPSIPPAPPSPPPPPPAGK
jgi:hypothetical protein